MATVDYWQGVWFTLDPSYALRPGDGDDWIYWGYNFGDAISVTAHPCCIFDPMPAPDLRQRIIAIENVQAEMNLTLDPGDPRLLGPEERRLFFTVRNVGQTPVDGYYIGYGRIH